MRTHRIRPTEALCRTGILGAEDTTHKDKNRSKPFQVADTWAPFDLITQIRSHHGLYFASRKGGPVIPKQMTENKLLCFVQGKSFEGDKAGAGGRASG